MNTAPRSITTRRRLILTCAILGTLVVQASIGRAAFAQDPWRAAAPIKLIVPFAPGGGADVVARLLAPGMRERLGQPVVVENKAGASGAIGSDQVFFGPANGTSLLIASVDSQAMNPHLTKVRFDTQKFVPLGGIARTPFVLVGRPDLPAANLTELLQLMKKQSLNYSTGGTGSSMHVVMGVFGSATGSTSLTQVPYQGAGPALQAVLASQVDLLMVPASIVKQHLSRLKVYGTTSAQRVPTMTGVPTLKEAGASVIADSWTGLVAPPGTPDATAKAIASAMQETIATADFRKKLADLQLAAFPPDNAAFANFYREEYERWGQAIRSLGIKVD